MFDIDLPDDPVADTPETEVKRRGPMASAIAENAEALQTRASAAQAIRDENDALAHEYVALQRAGQVVAQVPLEDVHTYMLARDRMPGDDYELGELVTSIRDLGLSNPIRVLPRPDASGGFELVQGFRRLSAYRQLLAETGEAQWATIPALVMEGAPDIGGLYRRMVDENVIRKDLSFAEMAQAAQNYAADPATDAVDLGDAVAALFSSAPYSKRSYIRSFAQLLDALSPALDFPAEIPRALGVALARRIKEEPQIAVRIRAELSDWNNRSILDELGVLRRYAETTEIGEALGDDGAKPKGRPKGAGAKPKTTFHLTSRAGQVKCTAAAGRLEIKVDKDFSGMDRARLERAIAALIDQID
jgi:ParB family chromosome partitioning protein